MRFFSKITAVFLIIALFMSLSACGVSKKDDDDVDGNGVDGVAGEGDIVMSYEGLNLTESEFKCIAAFVKDQEIYGRQYMLYQQTGQAYSEADILAMYVNEDTTVADYLMDYTIEFAQRMLILEKLCADAGISITDQSDIEEIDNYMSDIEYAHGGEDLFEIELVKLGFTRNGIKRYQSLSYLFELLYDSRYGENGTARISKADIEKYFVENYYCFDGAVYSYVDSEKGSIIMFDYTDEQVKEYFNENFVKVRHILYKTIDSSMKPLSDSAKAEKKAKAEAAFKAISDDGRLFDHYLSDNEDAQSEYVFTKGEMVEAFENASFEMVAGNVRLVETEYGYHIIQKLELTDEDLVGTVGDDGKTKNDRRETVKKAMSIARIRSEALDMVSKLNRGELKEYPAKSESKPYYSLVNSAFIEKSDTQYANLVKLLSDAEYNVYNQQDFRSSGTQVYRKLEFGADKITSDIYTTIEEKLSAEALVNYMVDFYDSVEIDSDYFDSFDIVSLPLLENEFYIQ